MTVIKKIVFLVLLTLLFLVSNVHAEFYRWVDSEGTIHYSDSMPPTESQQEQDVLNDHGRVVKNIPAPKTLSELEEEKLLAERAEEERRKIEAAEQRDRSLLAIYLSVEDIELVRDERIETVESAIKITQRRQNKFTKKLEELDASEQKLLASGSKTPPWLTKSRKHFQEQLANVEDILKIKEREKLQIKKRFAGDINRYLELKEPGLATQ